MVYAAQWVGSGRAGILEPDLNSWQVEPGNLLQVGSRVGFSTIKTQPETDPLRGVASAAEHNGLLVRLSTTGDLERRPKD